MRVILRETILFLIIGILSIFFSGCSYSDQEGIVKVNMQYHNQIQVITATFYEDMRQLNIREKNQDSVKSILYNHIQSVYLPKICHLSDRLQIEKYGTRKQRTLIEKELILTNKYFLICAGMFNPDNSSEIFNSQDLVILDRDLFDQKILYEDYYNKLTKGKSIIEFNREKINSLKKGFSYKEICAILGFPGICKGRKIVVWNEEERLIEVYLWSRDTEKLYVVFINGKAIKFSSEFKWHLFNMN